jgi:hypothetical protein
VRWLLPGVSALGSTVVLAMVTMPASQTLPTSAPALEPVIPRAADRIADYQLKARVDLNEKTIAGVARITWRNRANKPANELCLHLYLNAFRSKETLFYKGSGGQSRGNVVKEPGEIKASNALVNGQSMPITETNDGTTALIALETPIQPNEEITLEINFFDQMPGISARAGAIDDFMMAGQWFPKLGVFTDGGWECEPYYAFGEFFSDFGAYDVTIESPKGALVAASGGVGQRLDDTSDGFEARRFQVSPVHDFSFAVARGFTEQTTQVGDVSVRMVYPIGEERSAAKHIEAVKRGLPFFDEWLGEYPYPWLTVVQVPEKARGAGGMEYPTLITTWKSREIPLLENNVAVATTMHELAHQWFYGLVASNEVAFPFLDEGLTSYATARAMDRLYGSVLSMGDVFSVQSEEIDRLQGLFGGSVDPIIQPANWFRDSASYGAASYGRTSLALATMRELTPSGMLDAAIGVYARKFRFAHPAPKDLYEVLSTSLKREIKTFWTQAFEESGTFDYSLRSMKEQDKEVTVSIERKGQHIAPARVVLHLKDGTIKEAIWTEAEQEESKRAWREFLFTDVKGFVWAEVVPLPSEYERHNNAAWSEETRGTVERQSFVSIGAVLEFVGATTILLGW